MTNTRSLLSVILYLALLSVMNITMFYVALPNIAKEFSLTPSQVSWVVTGYVIVIAVGATIYGKLTQLYNPRRLLVLGLILFAIGSVVGLLASNYLTVIIARLIQASGAAAIPSIGMFLISKYIPVERRGYALGLFSAVMGLGTGVGPVLGGLLTQYGNWKMLFFVPMLSILAIPFLFLLLPKEKPSGQSFDLVGAMLFLGAVVTLLMGVNTNLYFLLASVLLFALFFAKNKRSPYPFIQTSLLKNKTYRALLMIIFIAFATTFSVSLIVPLMLKKIYHFEAGVIGFALLPGALLATILGGWIGKLNDRFGNRIVIQWTAWIMVVTFLLISTFIGLSPFLLIGMFIFVYVGFSSFQSGASSYVSKILGPQEIGIGLGIYNLSSFLGGAFGPALISRFVELDTGHWNPFAHNATYSNAFLLLMLASLISAGLIFAVKRREQKMAKIRIDVSETDTEVIVTAESPGLEKKEDVTITVHNKHLHLSGKIERSHEAKTHSLHRTERFFGQFSRTISLPSHVEETGAKASYCNGILEIRLPKQLGKQIDIDFHH